MKRIVIIGALVVVFAAVLGIILVNAQRPQEVQRPQATHVVVTVPQTTPAKLTAPVAPVAPEAPQQPRPKIRCTNGALIGGLCGTPQQQATARANRNAAIAANAPSTPSTPPINHHCGATAHWDTGQQGCVPNPLPPSHCPSDTLPVGNTCQVITQASVPCKYGAYLDYPNDCATQAEAQKARGH